MKKNNRIRPINLDNSKMNNPMGYEERTSIEPYLNEIRNYPAFSRDEEIKAVKKAKTGNEEAFENFIKHNLLLVYKAARHYMHTGLPLEDLIQYGNIGLIKSARAYIEHEDYYLKNRFNTYAVWYIRKEITDAIEVHGSIIRHPHDWNVLSGKIKKVSESFEVKYGRLPKTDELSKIIGEDEKKIIDTMSSMLTSFSTDTPIGEKDADDRQDTYGDMLMSSDRADNIVSENDTKFEVKTLLSSLNERERLVVTMTYGIGYDYERDPKAIGEELGCSPTTVKNIMSKAVEKMQRAAANFN